MKNVITSALLILGVFSFISCERHSWEDSKDGKGTKRLFPKSEHAEHADHAKEKYPKNDHAEEHHGHDHGDHAHDHDGHNH